ncbi:MAG: hypothetical protein GC162_12670 [Planctomycetes bacterium]|nr:hypothetical protein [Planctomycetota bacterium]
MRRIFIGLMAMAIAWAMGPEARLVQAAPTDRAATSDLGVAFPGPPPGAAQCRTSGDVLTLQNAVLAASWRVSGVALTPLTWVNKLTQASFDQTGARLFSVATQPQEAGPSGAAYVAIQLDADEVFVLASQDGLTWTQITSFPRADYPGEPRLVRIGKMDVLAMPVNHRGGLGDSGESTISELAVAPEVGALPRDPFVISARAHEAKIKEYPFPAGARMISCRIDKGTDQGQTWGPALALIWEDGKRFVLIGRRDKATSFNVETAKGQKIHGAKLSGYLADDASPAKFRLTAPPVVSRIEPAPDGGRIADRIGGMAIEATFTSDRGIDAHWRAELRDGSNYIRQIVTFSTTKPSVPLTGVELCDVRVPDGYTVGRCPGCPVAAAHNSLFFGVEMPGAQNAVNPIRTRIGFTCSLTLTSEQSYTFGQVAGVAPEGQLRRAFLCYIERERARPTSPFLHYNSWYDMGSSPNEEKLLDVVQQYNKELVEGRGVPVMSYLIDDGWDDASKGFWIENKRAFPGGFQSVSRKMAESGARMGIWISPLGGYNGRKERTEWARKMGLIPSDSALDLAQPGYRKWFEERCIELMRQDGVNIFKWDKAGDGVSPHFMALLGVAQALRKVNPELFINVTVGTWPSPFWLNHIDCTWRNDSSDVGWWVGKGDIRERWLTYRDGYCHQLFVEKSPLYPLNSVMHHGIVLGRHLQGASVAEAGPHLKHDARAFFANGTSLQELYLTPSMMTPEAWDHVAEAAKWAHANADVLRDAHWFGGDPLRVEAYGYAAWSPRKGTLMIRNPDDQPQSITLDAATVFELPAGAGRHYTLTSPYADQRVQTLKLDAGVKQTLTLEPFEVLVFDAMPQ